MKYLIGALLGIISLTFVVSVFSQTLKWGNESYDCVNSGGEYSASKEKRYCISPAKVINY